MGIWRRSRVYLASPGGAADPPAGSLLTMKALAPEVFGISRIAFSAPAGSTPTERGAPPNAIHNWYALGPGDGSDLTTTTVLSSAVDDTTTTVPPSMVLALTLASGAASTWLIC